MVQIGQLLWRPRAKIDFSVFKSKLPNLATLVHEYAHEPMHKSDRRTGTTKTVRETEAEAVAFAVCSGLGLDCGSSSSDYIGLYDGNADTLIASL
jgi:hypothetical protein